MSLGAGTNRRSPMPAISSTCQSAISPIGEIRKSSRSCVLGLIWDSFFHLRPRPGHLFLQHPPDVELELAELSRGRKLHEVARMGKRHLDDLFDAPGLRRH